MQQRRITLEDGRYLIFYTFEDEAALPAMSSVAASDKEQAPEANPAEAKAQEEEERSV